MKTRVASATKEVIIGDGLPTVIIGERINTTGRKSLAESLKAGSMDIVRKEAIEQVAAGADMLDVNVTVFGTDEPALLSQAVKTVSEVVDVPICIDSCNEDALAAALKACPGRPLVNSVWGDNASLAKILPLIKEHNAAVVGLLQDEEGIPHTAEKRLAIAHKIVTQAERLGIPRDSIIIDVLALTLGAEPASGRIILEAIARIKAELGVNITMGASNVSHGLPDRYILNAAFAAMVIAAGATCLITDAAKMRAPILATDLILERDKYARRYISNYRKQQQLAAQK
ncbi:MAG: dihydropteroate synthase [Chloroflexi bacterium]|nr:dihydropteroate synthase [Chloroflexota bacterium]